MESELARVIERLSRDHAGLERYSPAIRIDAAFEEARSKILEERTVLEFYRTLTRLTSTIRCAHTHVLMDEPDLNAALSHLGMLPFRVHLLGKRAWVTTVAGNVNTINPGDEIVAIDGWSIAEIRARVFRHLSGDGFIEAAKERQLAADLARYFSLFVDDHTRSRESFVIRLRNGEVVVPAITPAEYYKESHPQVNVRVPQLAMLKGDDAAILTISTFLDAPGFEFPPFLRKVFERLDTEGIGNLVIDLRGNLGGRDQYGAELISYLAANPFRYFHQIVVTDEYAGPQAGIIAKNGLRLVTDHSCLQLQQPASPRFDGKVVVLIDGWTASTAADVASTAHRLNLATFIGEETGGGYEGNTSGFVDALELSESRFRVLIPHWKYVTLPPGHSFSGFGVPPNYAVQPTIEDRLNGRDTVLEFAKQYLNDDHE